MTGESFKKCAKDIANFNDKKSPAFARLFAMQAASGEWFYRSPGVPWVLELGDQVNSV